jgi:type I restriction enzyme, S subunit
MSMTEKWMRRPLGEVADVVSGYAFKSSDFGQLGVPVVKIKNVRVGYIDIADADCVDESFLRIPERYHVSAGDVLISLTGSHISQPNSVVGRVARHPTGFPKCLLNQRVGKVIVKDHDACDLAFLFYVLSGREMMRSIALKAHGAANQANVSPSQIESIQVPLPQLPVQRRVVGILSIYDELIEINRRRIALLDEMARLLFEEWFVRCRFPGHEGCELVESLLGSLPKTWAVSSIDEICLRVTDGAHKSPPSIEAGIAMASVKDMRDWDFDLAGCRRISPEHYEELARNDCKPLSGDILIAKDGSCLKHTFLVRKERELAILSSIAILRPNGRMLPNLFVQFLRDRHVVQRMKGIVSGVAIPRIVLKDFKKFLLPLPPKELQQAWDSVAGPMHQLSWQLSEANIKLGLQRDLLLPRLISGEISVATAERELQAAA